MAKLVLAILCLASVGGAVWLGRPPVEEKPRDDAAALESRERVRLLTWNLGYPDVEADSRARTSDMTAVAREIDRQGVDAAALQELTGRAQLDALLDALGSAWRGHVTTRGATDRFEAVVVRGDEPRCDEIPAGGRWATVARFHPTRAGGREVALASVHAPAYSSLGRRAYVDAIVEWARRQRHATLLLAGDLNLDVTRHAGDSTFSDDAKRDGESYSQLVDRFVDLGRRAGPTAAGPRRIDYVFAPVGVSAWHAEVLRAATVGRMDHVPLLVEVALP